MKRTIVHIVIPMLLFVLLFGGCSDSKSENKSGTTKTGTQNTNSIYIDPDVALTGDGSQSSPYKTWAEVTFQAGYQYLQKKGTTAREQITINASGTSGNVITIGAYGSGADPIIDGSSEVTGWTNEGGGIYSKAMTLLADEGLGNLSEEGTMMGFIAWDDNYTTTFSGAGNGTFSYDNGTSTIYINVASDPSLKTYLASVKRRGVFVEDQNYIIVEKFEITRFSLHGIEFKNCNGCQANNISINQGGGMVLGSNPSGTPDYIYAGNGIEFGNSATNGTVNGATISEIFDSCLTNQTYDSNQTSGNFTYSNSTVEKCGFAGLEIVILSNGGTTGSTTTGVSISGVTINQCGKGWSGQRYGNEGVGIKIGADTNAGSISQVSVTDSIISDSTGDGIKILGEVNTVTLNRLNVKNNNGIGISLADATSITPRLDLSASLIHNNGGYGVYVNAQNAAGFNLYHNTFYDNTSINFAVFANAGTARLKNNLFDSSSTMTHLFTSSALTGTVDIDNNCYTDGTNIFGYNGTSYHSVSAFNAAVGFESNGQGSAAVLMTNPGSEIFTLQASSVCRGLGDNTTGITLDYSANNFTDPPSSGAHEYQ